MRHRDVPLISDQLYQSQKQFRPRALHENGRLEKPDALLPQVLPEEPNKI
jgi:hypothetical protein